MKSLYENHIEAFKIVFKSIAKYYWYWFFAPGLMIGLFYISIDSGLNAMHYEDPDSASISWLAKAWDGILDGISSFMESIYKFFLLTILSPLNAFFSEIMDSKLTNKKFSIPFWRIIKDLFRAILIFGVAIILEGVLWLIFKSFGWITGFDVLSSIIAFISGSFFIGFSFYDYALERHEFSFFQSWKFAFKNVLYMFVCGLLFELLYIIPFVGIIIAPVLLSLSSTVIFLIKDKQSHLNNDVVPVRFQSTPESPELIVEEKETKKLD